MVNVVESQKTSFNFSFFVFEDLNMEMVMRIILKSYEDAMKDRNQIPTFGEIVDLCQSLFHSGVIDIIQNKIDNIEHHLNYPMLSKLQANKDEQTLEQLTSAIASVFNLKDIEEVREHFFKDIKYILDHYLNVSYFEGFGLKHLHTGHHKEYKLCNQSIVEVW